MEDKERELTDLKNKLEEMGNLNSVENLIKDNQIEFEHKNKTYRVRQPSPKERREVNKQRMKEYTSLIQDDAYMTKEELKNQYKDKGIDIDGMETRLTELDNKEENLLMKLSKTDNDSRVEELEEKIADVRVKQDKIVNRIEELLQYSIEELLNDFVETYFCYLLLEEKKHESGKEPKWVSTFDSYEDFMDCQDNALIMKSAYYLITLIGTQNIADME